MFQIRKISRDILATLVRFPVPILSATMAFLCIFTEIHFIEKGSNESKNYIFIRLFLECVSGISYFIAVDIFAQSKKIEFSKRLGLYLLGFCILGLHYFSITPGMFDSESVFVSRYLIFITCFHLAVSFLAFFHRDEIDSFWQYNFFLLVKFLLAFVFSLTLFVGLGGALLGIDKLFDVNLDLKYYLDLALFIFLIVQTIIFLYFIPESFEVFKFRQVFSKSIRIFVQYILLPIVLVYIIILYLFLFRIIIYNAIPSGWVCTPILIFSITGILTYLLVYPIRLQSANKAIFVYAKYFFYILLPLLALYFIAIIKRILPYGITEDRYLVFILGVWLLIISVYIIVSKRDNIVVIPISLFLLLFISAIGPWGMFQLSVQNQVRRLEFLLKKNNLLVNQKLITPPKDFQIPEQNANSIRSILNYLNKRGEINKIHPWLGDKDQQILTEAIRHNELNAVNAIFTNIHLEQEPVFTFQNFSPARKFVSETPIEMGNFKNIVAFTRYSDGKSKELYMAEYADSNLYIFKNKDTLAKSPFTQMMLSLHKKSKMQDSSENAMIPLRTQLQIMTNEQSKNYALPNDSLVIRSDKFIICFNLIGLYKQDTVYGLKNLNGYLIFP